jgi:nucleoside-diphosphate-sugar epimerase
LSGFDAVIHLAELSNDPLGQFKPEITYNINHQGSVGLAEKSKEAGIKRFVYSSSCSVYGIGTGDYKTEESTPQPITAYAKCKVLVEQDVSKLADDDFSPTFLRNATAYGPSPRMRFDIVVNNLTGLAFTEKEIRLTSDGTPWRPLVHVMDICEAILSTLEAPREVIHNQIFNVGSTDENYQIRDIANIVAECFPDCTLNIGKSDGDDRSYRVAFDKIHTHLPSFQCRRTVKTGVRQLRDLFELIGLENAEFNSRYYTRLKQLKHLYKTHQINDQFYWNTV